MAASVESVTGADKKQPRKLHGSISLYCGPMFSGKTSMIIAKVRRSAIVGFKCVVIKWAGDQRYKKGPVVATHDRKELESTKATAEQERIRVVEASKLADVAIENDEMVVGIDEGQFFPDLKLSDQWASDGKKIFIAALDSDFKGNSFPSMVNFATFCENVNKLHAVCMMCRKRPGNFTIRTTASQELIVIGAGDYKAVCRTCRIKGVEPAAPPP